MTFHLAPGPGEPPAIDGGPYDARLGYANLRTTVEGLRNAGFQVIGHAQLSRLGTTGLKIGLPPIYREKTEAGLLVQDDQERPLYQALTPRQVYRDSSSIPQLIVQSLLLAENREMLDASRPYRNPTIEWSRLTRAVFDFGLHRVYDGHPVTGGSTVATQLEKLRHSIGGRTASATDKFRQMLAASLRAYQSGPNNLSARNEIVCDYINSLPLAATVGQGEVIGLADGLQAWFGIPAAQVNALLNLSDQEAEAAAQFPEKAIAYRQSLTLLLAAKKPSTYLVSDRAALARRVDAYLPLLAQEGVISVSLRDATLKTTLVFRNEAARSSPQRVALRKSSDAIRIGLLPILGVKRLYDLDRLDLTVQTGVDWRASTGVADKLQSLTDPIAQIKAGLYGAYLLHPGAAHPVVFSFTLYERSSGGNILRVQADNYNQPLNINQGTKLELGSTAKLRALACYLELISELHVRLANKTSEELKRVSVDSDDGLSIWAIRYLSTTSDKSLSAMLDAAINKTYSASPAETFFTGGGAHTFANFEPKDNGRTLTVREAFERSINLVFIRLLRDVVHYRIFEHGEAREVLDSSANSQLRLQYLGRFADIEGRQYLERFYLKYKKHPESAWLARLKESPLTGTRFAAIYRYVWPDADLSQFQKFAASHALPVRPEEMERLYTKYGPHKFALNDLAYLAHAHPLDLWLAAYLSHRPSARETVLEPKPENGERVMSVEVAAILQRELIGVVEHGTGQRARKSVVLEDGQVILVGGKTGTGDNRIEEFGPSGSVVSSKVRNRTAAFVFTIGDRFFGTVLAYSAGTDAAAQSFTSALAVQLFRELIPSLRPLLTTGLRAEDPDHARLATANP
ncbi:MAG: transglycosylase domain-containing protein [Acidobacteriota bacterium]